MNVSKLIVGLVVASFSFASFALATGQSNHTFGKVAAAKSKMNANKDNKDKKDNKDNKDNKDKNGKKGKKGKKNKKN